MHKISKAFSNTKDNNPTNTRTKILLPHPFQEDGGTETVKWISLQLMHESISYQK
jgi:hypothetical protein